MQEEETKPHIKDFLIFVFVLILIIIGTVFMFSRNSSNNNTSKKPDINIASDSSKTQVEKSSATDSSKTEVEKPAESKSSKVQVKKYTIAKDMKININKKYFAEMITNMGNIEVELFPKETPVTVNNFVFLSREGFYDNTIFHRIIKDFMIQGGDPEGTGMGGPGYKFADEKISRDYKRGVMAMANSGPNTNGSQFFIMHKDYQLPKNYVIFGEVTKGIETVDKLADVPTADSGTGEKSKPLNEVKIEKIEIREQ